MMMLKGTRTIVKVPEGTYCVKQVIYNLIMHGIILKLVIIKSPQSGVTLCFQFVSTASAATTASAAASAVATTFASHVKTVWAKP